jgi:hypothetical protein
MKSNTYAYIDYDTSRFPNEVAMIGYNSSNYDLNFFFNILHNPPEWFLSKIIGILTKFKMIKVIHKTGVTLRFLDAMNYTTPQPLKDFVRSFGTLKDEMKGLFAYAAINTDNYEEVWSEPAPFRIEDFKSYLKNTECSEKYYDDYIGEWKRMGFQTRWDLLKCYNIIDVKIMVSPLQNLIHMMFYGDPNVKS